MKKYNIHGIEFFTRDGRDYVTINQTGLEATYPFEMPKTELPIKTVLLDLDGTSVKSEEFWMYLLEVTFQHLTGNKDFHLAEEDIPYTSGFTTQEHLAYIHNKYGFNTNPADEIDEYHKVAAFELNEIKEGRGNQEAMRPREGIKPFLLKLKENGIKIGVVTSGLEYKALPELLALCNNLELGDPLEFFDAVIMGGKRKGHGEYGTIGELAAKPHPWVYLEMQTALKNPKANTIVLEDSSSGLISALTAGINVIGFKDGNLIKSGLDDHCYAMVDTFDEVLKILNIK